MAESGPAAVCAAAARAEDGELGGEAVLAVLGRVPQARAELDRAEAGLIGAARVAGAPWSQIAAALGLGSYQAAAQRAARLTTSTGRLTNPAPASEAPRETPRTASSAAAPASIDPASTEAGSAQLPSGSGAADEPASARTRAGARRRRRPALTAPSVTTIAQRRRVTAADFDDDPLHELTRTADPGRWEVHDPTGVIGEVRRHGRRWQLTTTTGELLHAGTFGSRAEAAVQVIAAHRTLTDRRAGASTRR